MTSALAAQTGNLAAKLVLAGDLSTLNDQERVQYVAAICQRLGLDPLTQPFSLLRLSGKLTLYANKDGVAQLRAVHNVSLTITARELVGQIYVVTARATTPEGRSDESVGAVSVAGLNGENLANAYMKAETKAKRRATLSLLGLGMLDESEAETVPGAIRVEPSGIETPIGPPQERHSAIASAAPRSDSQRDLWKVAGDLCGGTKADDFYRLKDDLAALVSSAGYPVKGKDRDAFDQIDKCPLGAEINARMEATLSDKGKGFLVGQVHAFINWLAQDMGLDDESEPRIAPVTGEVLPPTGFFDDEEVPV